MFKIKSLIVLSIAALMLTAGCQIFNTSKTDEPPKTAKKDAKTKKDVLKKDAKVVKEDVKVKQAEVASKPQLAPAKNQPTNDNKDNDPQHGPKSMIGLGFCSPMQFPNEKTTVSGFRFSAFYTYNQAANGLDCGFVCDSGIGGTKGIQAGVIANRTAGPMTGLSLSLINIAETEINGIQIGGLYNEAGSNSQNNGAANYENSCGVQMGAANVANSIFRGLQLGAF